MVPIGKAFYILPKHNTVLIILNITAQHGLISQIKIHKKLLNNLEQMFHCSQQLPSENHRLHENIMFFKKKSFVLLKSVFHDYYNHAGMLRARHVEKHEADIASGNQLQTTQSQQTNTSPRQNNHKLKCRTAQCRQTKTTNVLQRQNDSLNSSLIPIDRPESAASIASRIMTQ